MKYNQPYHATYCWWCAVRIHCACLLLKAKFSMVCYCIICIEFVQGMCIKYYIYNTFMCQELYYLKAYLKCVKFIIHMTRIEVICVYDSLYRQTLSQRHYKN